MDRNVMTLRKNTVKSRSSSKNSFIEEQSRAAASLTNIIRRKSTLMRDHKEATGEDYKPATFDQPSPATDKLISMIHKKQ